MAWTKVASAFSCREPARPGFRYSRAITSTFGGAELSCAEAMHGAAKRTENPNSEHTRFFIRANLLVCISGGTERILSTKEGARSSNRGERVSERRRWVKRRYGKLRASWDPTRAQQCCAPTKKTQAYLWRRSASLKARFPE